MTSGGTVEEPISRHPTKRTHMSVHPMGKPAVTHYRIMEHFRIHTRLRLRLETGRTHQIRVHMAHIGHPLIGDPEYGASFRTKANLLEEPARSTVNRFPRQALHAYLLAFEHPRTGEVMEFETDMPEDMAQLANALRGPEHS